MKIIVDAEDVPNARTGIPRVTFLDIQVFSMLFAEVRLLVSKKNRNRFITSEENELLKSRFLNTEKCKIELSSHRPTNKSLWIWQQVGGYGFKDDIEFDFRYSSNFPYMYRSSKKTIDLIRLHDTFQKSEQISLKSAGMNQGKNVLARDLRNVAFKRALGKNPLLVANSFKTRSEFFDEYDLDSNQIHVIHPSVGFRSQHKFVENPLKVERPYIVSVMSQRQRKRPIFVINAWAKVATKLNLDFVQIGKIPLGDLNPDAAKHLSNQRLRVFESLTSNQLRELQRNAIASVFASSGEGFGMPIAESLFMGVPVMHNDLEVFAEVSGEIGLKFSLLKEETFIETLHTLTSDEFHYSKLREKSWQRGLFFSHEFSATKWRDILIKNDFEG
jgi:glycosyltransferase involved in cell wall biosynthesis